ncbi:MAG: MarC family transcriptional regulator [Chromatiales bacterium 21-64-14]|nr:MAG: MarC family transcriptional regulator [Chromatiales bacterium 21-64-14]HQU16493.1 MarC family protein [Gammaproteobacteria bacterium]
MSDLLFNTFILMLVVVDPVGLVPLFGALTQESPRLEQRRMAVKAVLLAGAILLVFAFAGNRLLTALGIGLPAFKIAGGALLFLLAIDMVFARQSGLRSTTRSEQREAVRRHDISVFPLAFPLIAGPGAITTLLLVLAGHRGDPAAVAGVLLVLGVVLLLTLGALLLTGHLMRWLGETGANVVSRVLGLVLTALAVQFVLDGIRAAFLIR